MPQGHTTGKATGIMHAADYVQSCRRSIDRSIERERGINVLLDANQCDKVKPTGLVLLTSRHKCNLLRNHIGKEMVAQFDLELEFDTLTSTSTQILLQHPATAPTVCLPSEKHPAKAPTVFTDLSRCVPCPSLSDQLRLLHRSVASLSFLSQPFRV